MCNIIANQSVHYSDVIMGMMASQITSLTIVYSTVHSGEDQWKHQSSASLTFVRGIHGWPVNSSHKWPVTRKMFPFDDVIMEIYIASSLCVHMWLVLIHYMMTSSSGNIFRVTGPLCGEFTGPGEFPAQRPVTRSFDVFFDLRPNKRLSKQSWGWWFETPSRSLWCHRNDMDVVVGSVFQGDHMQPLPDMCSYVRGLEWLCYLRVLQWLHHVRYRLCR